VRLKQEGFFLVYCFLQSEEVTGSLFNEEEVEQTVNNAYQIHKKFVSLSNQEWLLWISSGHIKECMSSFD
jgi:hypothetical protein